MTRICSKDQAEGGCTKIFSNPPINYTIINSNYICAKMSKLNYRELLQSNQVISKEKSCPIGYKLCGILDTLGHKFCIEEKETCPINENDINNIFVNLTNENNTIPLKNNSNAQLISIIKVNQYKPCINPSEKFWDYHYPLEPPDQRCVTEIKGKIYDERYQMISNYS